MIIDIKVIKDTVTELFIANGLIDEDARIVTNCLLDAELAGIITHGISMVPAHIKKLKASYQLNAEFIIEKSTVAFSVCNANNSIGMLSAWKCLQLAIDKSMESGMHMVLCHGANTFSAAYCYVKHAVECGKIAIIMSNSPAQMAPYRGKDKMLGTNPLAIGIPAFNELPFILDMATSVVSKSKINQALHRGETIPFGWATDIDGKPTNDPKKAVAGLLLPMAGAKGSGVCMAIDIMCGVLAQASYLDNIGRFYPLDNKCMDVGQIYIVIDPKIICGNNFYTDMDMYLKKVRKSRSISEDSVVFVPGDRNYGYYENKVKNGIEISEDLVRELNELLQNTGIKQLDEKETM